jgi:SAM-dependent methyltransferase
MTALKASITPEVADLGVDYTYLDYYEKSSLMDQIRSHIDSVGARPTRKQWDAAWQEIYDSELNQPKYLQSARTSLINGSVFRWNQDYITATDPKLEKKYHETVATNIIDHYFSNVDYVVEFGCGTGHNLVAVKRRRPDIKVYGSDFTDSSLKCLSRLGIPGFKFDLRDLDNDGVPLELRHHHSRVGILTMGALEQVGNKFSNFIKFCRSFQPAECVHVEPILELYDSSHPVDRLAIDYHRARGYLEGFFPALQEEGLLKSYERSTFGNSFNEGYTVLRWNT